MAKKSLVIEILGNNKMGRAVRDAMGSMKRLGSFAKGVGRGIASAFKVGVAGIVAVTAALAAATKIYATQEQADVDLASAIREHGGEVDKLLPKLKAQASAIQLETKYGDEFIETLQAQAINMGVAAEGSTEATRAALGLAKAYKMEVVGAMRLVTRARVGDTSSLKRYGIVLDDTLTAEQKYNAVLKIGAANYGLVKAEVNSVTGRFTQFKNVLGDVIEAFGGAFVEGVDLKDMLEKGSKKAAEFGQTLQQRLLPRFREMKEIIKDLIAGGGDRAAAIGRIGDIFKKAGTIVKPYFIEWGTAAGIAIADGFRNAKAKRKERWEEARSQLQGEGAVGTQSEAFAFITAKGKAETQLIAERARQISRGYSVGGISASQGVQGQKPLVESASSGLYRNPFIATGRTVRVEVVNAVELADGVNK